MEMIKRQNLFLLNSSDLCQGKITRHRVTKSGVEQSIIDFVVVCEFMYKKLVKMVIDEERNHTLTKYASTRGVISKSESDHNPLFCQFDIPHRSRANAEERRTIYNFKNAECQELFHDVSAGTDIFYMLDDENIPVEKRAQMFLHGLNDIFSKTFRKIRVRKKCLFKDPIHEYLKVKCKLKMYHRRCQNEDIKRFIAKKVETIEAIVSTGCSEENVRKVNEYLKNLEMENGEFSQGGMWKLKSQLCPTPCDPPTAKIDDNGNLVSNPDKLLELYLETYSKRLSHREIKEKYEDIFQLKSQLWKMRSEKCSGIKTDKWTKDNLKTVLKKLKKNKTRDPLGMVNEIFKPCVIGENLEAAILKLMNAIKSKNFVPSSLLMANITSIWKRKSSKKSLANDRGIFVLCVLRSLLDKLIYNDLYPEMESNMSNSNIGALKNKNIRNHLFVVYGIINSVLRGESPSVDIQIFDIVQCFDALWLEDVMNDLYDSLPLSGQNDKLTLLYKSNFENRVAVKTPVGQTKRINMPRIVMQGGSWGPIQCSNSIDKIGKRCEEEREHLYTYKNMVKLPVLTMVDDMLAVST